MIDSKRKFKLGSWNVNGLRACMAKGFMEFFNGEGFDVLGLQEIKMNKDQRLFELRSSGRKGQMDFDFGSYEEYWNSAERKGYSGTAVFAKQKPLAVYYDMGIPEHDREGRLITVEYEEFFFVTIYTPNAKRDLSRLDYRKQWEDDFKDYVVNLSKQKGVVICGDLNVAHNEIDLKNHKSNHKNAGFTKEERSKFTDLLAAGFIDTFRYTNPNLEGAYTWWSYGSRERNVGWRIDYFLVSEDLVDKIEAVKIYADVLGSDHCPVGLTLKF